MTPANLKNAGSERILGSVKTLRPIEDIKHLRTISEYGSVSRIRTETDLCLHEDMFPSFSCEENGRPNHLGEEEVPVSLLPNPESKSLNRKSLKKLTDFHCSKRLRTDQSNDSGMTAKADDQDAKKIGYDHLKCIPDDKCRIVKQKRVQDSKRIDKKSFKASVKTKFDPFISTTGFINSDSALGGIDTIGIFGLKSDLNDVTKHVEELSLDELLDGSQKYPNTCPEKGKKASNGNENILLSVRKACSILPFHGVADNGGNRKGLKSIQNPSLPLVNMSDMDKKDKCIEELSSKDSNQAMLSTSTLHQPKDILERLALPPSLDIEAIILNLNPSNCTMEKKGFYTSRLPPFPWSFLHGGLSKPGVDSCKFSLPRSAGQSKWVRIGSSSTSAAGDESCFSSLAVKTHDHIDDSINQQKIGKLLQDVQLLTESIMPPLDGPQHTSKSCVLDHSNIIEGSSAAGSLSSRKLELLDGHADTSDNHEEDASKYYLLHQNSESDVGLRCLRNLSSMDSPKSDSLLKGNVVGQKEHAERITDDCSRSCYIYPSKSSTGGCGQSSQHLPVPGISKPGHASQLLAAAEILCEMADCSKAIKALNDTSVRIKWGPSQSDLRDCKSTSAVEKTERFLASRHHDTFKRSALPSTKYKLLNEKKTDFAHTNNVGREYVKWSLSAEVDGASPRKLERDQVRVNPRLLHGNSLRTSGLVQSPIRVEKAYDNHQKHGKETFKASSVGFGKNYIKDWSRGRSKRV